MANSTVSGMVAVGGIVGASYYWSDIAIVAIMVAIVTVVIAVSELAKNRLRDANES